MQAPWTKICGNDQGSGKQVCYTTRDFGQAADQPPTLAIAVYQMSNEERRIARFLLPVGLLLKPGLPPGDRQGRTDRRQVRDLLPQRLFRRSRPQRQDADADLKKAQIASVIVRNQANIEVTFNLPMKDFGAAFDGPAVDPKVLEQQNQELQKQLRVARRRAAQEARAAAIRRAARAPRRRRRDPAK